MKKIEAIIRKTKFEEVWEALKEAGIEFFSYWDVRGVGQAREGRVYRWAFGLGLILFKTIKATVGLRVSRRIEEEGLDVYEHGESAYN